MLFRSVANSAYGSANNVAPQIAPAFNTANAAFAAANNVAPQVTPSYNTANLAFLNSNVAFNTANAAYGAANNITPQIAPSYNTANAAFAKANSSLQNTNITLAGNLSATGTHTLVQVPNYRNTPYINADYTVSNTYNEMSIGPINISNGVSVTVDTDANWVIV